MDQIAKDILESLEFIKDHMLTKEEGATKDDVRAIVREETADLRSDAAELKHDVADIKATMATSAELTQIRRDLEELREQLENVSGFRKEIDHALERIAAIERFIGASGANTLSDNTKRSH